MAFLMLTVVRANPGGFLAGMEVTTLSIHRNDLVVMRLDQFHPTQVQVHHILHIKVQVYHFAKQYLDA